MAGRSKIRVSRDGAGGIEPGSRGRNTASRPLPGVEAWVGRMQASQAGAKEVMVKVTGGGRDAGGVTAHFDYIDRHGKLEVETDRGEILKGKGVGQELTRDWGLDCGQGSGAPHSRRKREGKDGSAREGPRQAFNIVLSMPAGTPPGAVLAAARKFAREQFANQYRYAMALHVEEESGHGKHPHVHLVVKATHEYGGPRLNPRKADLRHWREQFAALMVEQGVFATATRRDDRGLVKMHKKPPIDQAMRRHMPEAGAQPRRLVVADLAGRSTFVREKLIRIARELKERGRVHDRTGHAAVEAIRSTVNARYRAAVAWLREGGRDHEAAAFARAMQTLPRVKSEREATADAILGRLVSDRHPDSRASRDEHRR